MTKRSTSLGAGPEHRRRGSPVVTRAFDLGHELRVVSRTASGEATTQPAGGGAGPAAPEARHRSTAPGPYDVPRSAWPAAARPVPPTAPGGARPEPANGTGGGRQVGGATTGVGEDRQAGAHRPSVAGPGSDGGGSNGAGRNGGGNDGAGSNGAGSNRGGSPSAAAPRGDGRAARTEPPGGGRAGTTGPASRPVSDDDVEADIAAIIAGAPSGGAGAPGQQQQPADEPEPGVPPGRNKQAIFDQIAASMSRARSYDLGSVELERRFDDFDRLQDAAPAGRRGAQRPATATATRPTVASERLVSRAPEAVATTATEVLQDLDAIRSRAQGSGIPLDPGVGGRSIAVDALEPGDIILSTTSHPLSEQIRAVTGSEVSHAAVYVGDGRLVEAIEGGVILRSVDTAVDDDTLAVAYRHRDMTPAKAALMIPFLEEHARKRTAFDHWGLIQVAPGQLARAICNRLDGPARHACLARAGQLRVGTNDDDTFFCSELVLEAFELAGLPMSTLEPSWSSPGQIAELGLNGHLDYVGHLKA